MEENKVLLDVQGLKMHFPVRGKGLSKNGSVLKAVDDVSFSIQRGRTFGLVGESGCGKTTVGRTILKLYQATAGKVIYNGKDLTAMTDKEFFPMRRELQMIFQDPMTSLDPRQTVNEIVGGPLRLQKMVGSKKEQDERVLELLHMVGLKDDHANRYPHEFSGGQRQRIGIARALGLEPRFIVCDEPISALDVSIQAQVVNLLEDFQERLGLTYLFISDDVETIIGYVDIYLKCVATFFIPLVWVNLYRNGIQGLGYGLLPMTAGIAEMVGRTVTAVFASRVHSYTGTCMASPVAWVLAGILLLFMYSYVMRQQEKRFASVPQEEEAGR